MIVRFVEEHQPTIVECEFQDADSRSHRIIDKCWVFTQETLWADSIYPAAGGIRCRVLEVRRDDQGRNLALVSITEPDHMETTEDLSEFLVLASQVLEDEPV